MMSSIIVSLLLLLCVCVCVEGTVSSKSEHSARKEYTEKDALHQEDSEHPSGQSDTRAKLPAVAGKSVLTDNRAAYSARRHDDVLESFTQKDLGSMDHESTAAKYAVMTKEDLVAEEKRIAYEGQRAGTTRVTDLQGSRDSLQGNVLTNLNAKFQLILDANDSVQAAKDIEFPEYAKIQAIYSSGDAATETISPAQLTYIGLRKDLSIADGGRIQSLLAAIKKFLKVPSQLNLLMDIFAKIMAINAPMNKKSLLLAAEEHISNKYSLLVARIGGGPPVENSLRFSEVEWEYIGDRAALSTEDARQILILLGAVSSLSLDLV